MKVFRPETADLVGRTSVKGLRDEARVKELYPGANSVAVLAVAVLAGPLATGQSRHAVHEFRSVDDRLIAAARELAVNLENGGYQAVPVPPFYPLEMSAATKGMVGDVSLVGAAVNAGMGILGKNNLFISGKWGCRLRLAGVVSDAPVECLPADDIPAGGDLGKRCEKCSLCADACPGGAITDSGFKLNACLKQTGGPYGLKSLLRYGTEIVEAITSDPQQAVAAINSERTWNFYQTLMTGMYFNCFECMRICPLSERGIND